MSDQQQETPAAPPKGNGRSGPNTIAVRYGHMNFLGQFRLPRDLELPGWDVRLVVQTPRGCEIGQAVSLTCTRDGAPSIPVEQMEAYVKSCGKDFMLPDAGRVLRVATQQDLDEHRRLSEGTAEKMAVCREQVAKLDLPMKLVACEHLLGGERIVFYFMAEGRVDFRQLVRELAHEYQTRIEMRQIGARDEARLVADYEICGRECCCKGFLKMLRPVSMKMAKTQKATLDPSKVSGRCGRLRCCLRYEQQTYQELARNLPNNGTVWQCEHGIGRVCGKHILTQLVDLAFEDGRRMAVPIEELSPPDPEGKVDKPAPHRQRDGTSPRPDSSRDGEGDKGKSRPPRAESQGEDEPDETESQEDKPSSSKRRRRRRPRRRGRGRKTGGAGPTGESGDAGGGGADGPDPDSGS